MVPVVTHLCFCIHLHASSTTASSVKDGCKHTTHKRLSECLKAGTGSNKHSLACVKCIKKSQQATCVYCIGWSVLQQIKRRLSSCMCNSSTAMCKQRSPHSKYLKQTMHTGYVVTTRAQVCDEHGGLPRVRQPRCMQSATLSAAPQSLDSLKD